MSGTVNKCAVNKHPKFTEIYFEFLLFYYDSDGSATFLGGPDTIALGEYSGEHVLGRRLADGTGNANDQAAKLGRTGLRRGCNR